MFKDRLKELRTKKGLSQQELADKIFVSRSAVNKWEMGNGVPSDANLEALCEFFEVDEEWLFDRDDLKNGIDIKEKEKNFFTLNIITLSINLIYIFIMIKNLFDKLNFKDNVYYIYNLFLPYEYITVFILLFIPLVLSVLFLLYYKNIINLKLNDESIKRYLKIFIVLLSTTFILYMTIQFYRTSNLHIYLNNLEELGIIVQDSLFIFIIIIILLFIFLKGKFLNIPSAILTVVSFFVFLISFVFFIYALYYSPLVQEDDYSLSVVLGFILNCIISFVGFNISTISLIFGIKSKSKTVIIINASLMTLFIFMPVLIQIVLSFF